MKKTEIVLLAIQIFFVTSCSSELFSAIDDLAKQIEKEEILMGILNDMSFETNDDYVSRKWYEWTEEHAFIKRNVQKYIANPLNAFLIIKRGTAEIGLIEKRHPDVFEVYKERISKLRPSKADLRGAVEGLLRLQHIYKFHTYDFYEGIIGDELTRPALTPHDLFVIGMEAYDIQDYFFAMEYLHLTRELLGKKRDNYKEVDEVLLYTTLASGYNQTGFFEGAIDMILEMEPNKKVISEQTRQHIDVLLNSYWDLYNMYNHSLIIDYDAYLDDYGDKIVYNIEHEDILMSRACRGNLTKSPIELSLLKCRYVSNSPFSSIAPFKVEEANLDPYVALYIDVLYNNEIEYLMNELKPKLERAEMIGIDGERITSNARVAKNAWLYNDTDEIPMRIDRRIEDMTGLTQSTSEKLQVSNYGIAGHYNLHWDHSTKNEAEFDGGTGNRIATMMFYMSDVLIGGETVFPYLKLRITPDKRTAVFWYNLDHSGQGISVTRHAACPVALGSKWVLNRWIRERGQEFRRPCLPGKYKEIDDELLPNEMF
ncbi:CLUMA_CG010787, isoform A [Clunio marinus]|uniref:procollagen-proline 4-dioxygenase n=1 Tax=Clunio marinus TaxID=568069 RepID=A0A1J1IAT3_9DIPT|nr:CLUMA_CG010787, isoform A [Clunio marinus]